MAKAEASVEELVGMIERGELRLPDGSSLGILVAFNNFNHLLSNSYRHTTFNIRCLYMPTILQRIDFKGNVILIKRCKINDL